MLINSLLNRWLKECVHLTVRNHYDPPELDASLVSGLRKNKFLNLKKNGFIVLDTGLGFCSDFAIF